MIRVIALALLLVGVSVGAKAWLAQSPTAAPPPPASPTQGGFVDLSKMLIITGN